MQCNGMGLWLDASDSKIPLGCIHKLEMKRGGGSLAFLLWQIYLKIVFYKLFANSATR